MGDGLPPIAPDTIGARCDALFPNPDEPIVGYISIARAVSRLLNTSCGVLAAKRLSSMGRENRLPVWKWSVLNRVFLLPRHLKCWAILALVPSGAVVPRGAPKKPRLGPKKKPRRR